MIDLRSDTVTKPTPSMREAMLAAPVARLQERTAELLGKQAAIFMPSGTMTNQIALRVHCSPGDEFICDMECHIYNYEQGAFAQLSGLVAKTIVGKNGVIELEQLKGSVRPDNEHMVRTRLLSLENTHNRGGGRVLPQKKVVDACNWAHASGLKTHLDGARLFNASVATGLSPQALAEPFDSISVCFSKGIGAPVGSCLVGPKEFIAKARRARKLFGGGMRQSGIIAAGALYALEHNIDRLAIDHRHAQQLAQTIRECSALRLLDDSVDSNIVIFHVDPSWGTAQQFVDAMLARRVSALAFGPQSVRFVTHLDVSAADIEVGCRVVSQVAATLAVTA
jgi:threonine aldolase